LRSAARLHAAALAWLLAGLAAAGAQEAAAPAAAPEPAPAVAIPLAQIAERAEQSEQVARRIEALAEPTPEIVDYEARLERNAQELADRAKRAQRLAADPPSLVALDEELKTWQFAQDELANARAAITARLTVLEQGLAELAPHHEVWKVTEEEAQRAGAPVALIERVRSVRRTLRDAGRAVERRRDQLLALQTRVAEQEQRAGASLETLEAARSSFRSLLLLRDKPTLWRAVIAPDRATLIQEVSARLADQAEALRGFVVSRWDRLTLQGLLIALAMLGGLALRRRAAAWRADDPRLEASAVVFERPLSAALLLALSLTPIFHPRAPRVVDSLVTAALIAPVLRLLPRLLDPALVPAAYGLAGLALLDQVRNVLGTRLFAERSLLLLETLLAAALLYWMLRPARLAELPAGTQLPRALGRALRGAFVLLAAATLANLFGWLNLARVLAQGVLNSAYLAVVLYGGVRVLRTAARALLRSESVRRVGLVRRHATRIYEWTRRAINVAALFAWAWVTLGAFGLEDWTQERVAALLSAEARFGTVGVSLADIISFALTLIGAFLLARLLRVVLEEDVVPRLPARRGLGFAVTSTVQYTVVGVGFLLAISAAGVDLNRVSLLAGALGVGVGFGLQNVVNNFVSGLILLYERPVQIGDMVEVGGVTGEVRRIGIRSSTIRTFQGAEVIVPNGNLISDKVVNWTFSDRRRRMEVKVGVAYGTDPERVIALLESVARAHPDVLDEPPAQALFVGFGESSLDFELRAWSALFENYVITQSQLAVAVSRALAEAGIEIPFPQRDLHLRTAPPARAEPPDAGRRGDPA
jgi:small-conductance mechanosensitive channel